MKYNYVAPRTPVYNRGAIVFHVDDGLLNNYEVWYPLFRQLAHKNDQWYPFNSAVFCPAVNTGYFGGMSPVHSAVPAEAIRPCMSAAQVLELQKWGSEILSHGKYHVTFKDYPLALPANAGDNKIYHSRPWFAYRQNLTYTLTEGTTVETFTISAVNAVDGKGEITLNSPLTNSFTTNAKIQITKSSLTVVVQSCLDDLANLGIICKTHVLAFYESNTTTLGWVGELVDNIVTTIGTNNPDVINEKDIKRTQDIVLVDKATIDSWLDDAINNDWVIFVQGHGDTNAKAIENLTYIISECYRRGVRILPHSKGMEYWKKRNGV